MLLIWKQENNVHYLRLWCLITAVNGACASLNINCDVVQLVVGLLGVQLLGQLANLIVGGH